MEIWRNKFTSENNKQIEAYANEQASLPNRGVSRHKVIPCTDSVGAQTGVGKKTSKILVFCYLLAMIL